MNSVKLATKVWQDPKYFIAFGFGSGLMPIAPGTWGTLAAIPLYLLMVGLPSWLYLLLTALAFLLGVWVSDKVSRDLGVHDFSGIVWDEVVGYLLTMFLIPFSLRWMIAGFLLFRLFDIWKPQPIGLVDAKVRGGLGIMLDDVLAAIPAWLILQLLAWSFSQ
ncbi:MAG: phosphatidylglycerophosphatase A [Tatlockia sp.]|nr:phosphatidylglycerophosphatase A [Tatlockia sp.]